MKYIHPAYRFMLADLAEIDLGCFEILMSQDNLGHDFQLKGLIIGGLSDLTLLGRTAWRGLFVRRDFEHGWDPLDEGERSVRTVRVSEPRL
ncbi:MAG TPA: hypothetical protein PLR60_01715 [Syntrophorhabdaceae bacterium]|nr:hypothetical protein [Syntrophorhabdaceae bacterium]